MSNKTIGFMSRLGFGDESIPAQSKAADCLAVESVLKATDRSVFSPSNPGSLGSVRTAPVVGNPRYFTRQEADALAQLLREKQEQKEHAYRSYAALQGIEKADAAVHCLHYNYAAQVASSELQKLSATQNYAVNLHALRPGMAALGTDLSHAANQASDRIAAIKAGLRSR